MIIRKTVPSDVKACDDIYAEAKRFMHSGGNPNQWNGAYPSGDDVVKDIEMGIGYVCENDGEVVGVFVFNVGEEPTYRIIDGEWKKEGEYAYIHRIAVKYRGMGIAEFIFNECFKMYPSLKIDTHSDNIPMQKALLRNGFEYCGVIHLENGDPRLAFQRV